MLENITRHMEMGKSRLQATLDGTKEIGFTVVSMTLSLVAVFIPVLLMGGILGRLLHEFAVTIIVAVLLSGFVSLTLTPLLCSRMLKVERKEDHGRIFAANERAFQAVLGAYGRSLHWALRHRRLTMLVFAAIFAGTGFLFSWMPKGFLPSDDVGSAVRHHRGRAGHLVRRDEEPAAAGGRDHPAQSARRERDVVRGRGRAELLAQQRAASSSR